VEKQELKLRDDLTIAQQIVTVPNLLTILRIALFFVLVHYLKVARDTGSFLPAVITGSVMLLTDILDGWFARKLNQATFVGSILDPISDKLIVAGLGIVLYNLGYIPFWLIGLILLRDLIILVLGIEVIRSMKQPFRPNIFARLTPFSWGLTYILFVAELGTPGWIMGGIALFLTLYSGIGYMKRYVDWKRESSTAKEKGKV